MIATKQDLLDVLATGGNTIVRAPGGLALRAAPSLEASIPVLARMPDGAAFNLTGDGRLGFVQGTFQGTQGWAFSEFLVAPGGNFGAGDVATVNSAEGLNLRAAPSLADGGQVLALMPNGAAFALTGEGRIGFVEGIFNGQRGWAFAEYLGTNEDSPPGRIIVTRRFYHDFVGQGRFEVAEELLAPDFVEINAYTGAATGRQELLRGVASFRAAFPDLAVVVDDLAVGEDRVIARVTLHGTHLGDWYGIHPTGMPVNLSLSDTFNVAGGQDRAAWRDPPRARVAAATWHVDQRLCRAVCRAAAGMATDHRAAGVGSVALIAPPDTGWSGAQS